MIGGKGRPRLRAGPRGARNLLGLDAGEMMALLCLLRQPLHEAGRNATGTCVPSAGEPQRHLLTVLPAPLGGLPVLSSGITVRSMVSMPRSLNPPMRTLLPRPRPPHATA